MRQISLPFNYSKMLINYIINFFTDLKLKKLISLHITKSSINCIKIIGKYSQLFCNSIFLTPQTQRNLTLKIFIIQRLQQLFYCIDTVPLIKKIKKKYS